MNSQIFAYLKRKRLTDTQTVNRLFVSAFVSLWGIKVTHNQIIANLLIKKDDADYDLLQEFISVISRYNSNQISIEDLVELFEFVISPADRIVTGAIYTPANIRQCIISTCLADIASDKLGEVRIADISCGCGGFLMDIALFLHKTTGKPFKEIFEQQIYGVDIQQYSVERTEILLSLVALLYEEDINITFNIIRADTLDYNTPVWDQKYTQFDVIVGNPPYVCSRNVDKKTKVKMLRYEVCTSGHPDLYLPFFQIATEMLKDGGKLGLITMNSFLRSINGRAVRKYLSDGSHDISILDFRGYQVFRNKSTYTCLFFLSKNKRSEFLRYAVSENGDLKAPLYTAVPYILLDNKKGWSLNGFEYVRNIESTGTPIGKYCQSRHGVATLCNKVYIFRPVSEDEAYYYRDVKGKIFAIEKSICRDIVNSNKLNSEVSLESITEKIIYPYIVRDGRAVIIDEQTMQRSYPRVYAYLSEYKSLLATRDKGVTNKYPVWYAYGRTQSLVMPRYKLFFPKIANKPLHCIIKDDVELMLYNGLAFVSDNPEKLKILKKVMDSDLFWDYVVKNAKPYASGYYSLTGVDIKNFSI